MVVWRWEPTLRRASLMALVALGAALLLLPIMFALKCDLNPLEPTEVERYENFQVQNAVSGFFSENWGGGGLLRQDLLLF